MVASRRPKAALTIAIAAILVLSAVAASYLVIRLPSQTASSSTSTVSSQATTLALSGTFSLQGTQGRVDHMAVDLREGVLYVAALGNNSVGVVDIASSRLVKAITNLSAPQGVAFDPTNGKLFVSNAGDGTLSVYNSKNLTLRDKVSFPGGDADNLRLDAANRFLYVGYGSGNVGGIAKVNATSDKVVQEFPLPGHPESFQVQANNQLIFVNVPTANILEMINGSTGRSVSNYTLGANTGNFPMALDEADARLFVATRSPSLLMVFDTSTPSLKRVANVTIAGDPDDIFYDSARSLVYVSCGQGSLEVIKQSDPNHYSVAQTIATASGARTSLFLPELGSIFVAVPASTGQQAEILTYGFGAASISSTSPSSSLSSTTTIITSAPIPSSASLSVTPSSGPSGLVVSLAGKGFVPGVTYQVCVGGFGNSTCGFQYVSADYITTIDQLATLGSFTADSAGDIPAGTMVTIPDLLGGGYLIGVVPYGAGVTFVSTPFKVETPTLSLSAVSIVSGGKVTLAGSGYAPSTTYTVCVVPPGTVDCGYTGDREEVPPGFWIGNFTTDAAGNIPQGTTLTTPLQPAQQDEVGVFMPALGFILIAEAQFTVTAG